MTRVALKGLLGRKVRAVLTALAIVLGVAMVSGSFVLTDTISKAFTSIFTSAYDQTDVVVSGKKLVDYSSSGNATVSPALLDADPQRAERRGGCRRAMRPERRLDAGEADRHGRQGDRQCRRADVRLRRRHVAAPVQPAQARVGPLGEGARRGRHRSRHGEERALRGRRHDRRRCTGPDAEVHASSASRSTATSNRSAERRSGSSRSRRRRSCSRSRATRRSPSPRSRASRRTSSQASSARSSPAPPR